MFLLALSLVLDDEIPECKSYHPNGMPEYCLKALVLQKRKLRDILHHNDVWSGRYFRATRLQTGHHTDVHARKTNGGSFVVHLTCTTSSFVWHQQKNEPLLKSTFELTVAHNKGCAKTAW